MQELESHKTALESRTGDTCPSLTKVDTETESDDFVADVSKRVQRTELKTLGEVVSHVKNFAGSRPVEEQLYYTDNDIRAFLAGMSVSRLIILQGMSGTGKSSLPRIFSEAISGFNRLIPVESSWRDRNELLYAVQTSMAVHSHSVNQGENLRALCEWSEDQACRNTGFRRQDCA